MEKNNAFKKGILTGFGFPGIGMSAAMFGFGVFAGEAGLDLYLCLGSLLILWSMPGMVIFVSLFSVGTPMFLLFTTVLLANMRQFFLVLSGLTLMNINQHKFSLIKIFLRLSYLKSLFVEPLYEPIIDGISLICFILSFAVI